MKFTNVLYDTSRIILAITNTRVDYLNSIIQQYNKTVLHTLYSSDSFAEVDDDYGNLQCLLIH